MEFPVDKWAEAILSRRSTRSFDTKLITKTQVQQLQIVADQLHLVCPAARAMVAAVVPEGIFKGIVGSYGAVKGAPACALFIADTTHPHYQEMIGYLGEGLILEATALGLATCWVGGFFRADVANKLTQLSEHERILAVTPLGYRTELRWDEKLMQRVARSSKRKSLDKISTPAPETWPTWAKAGLEAARLAPSAVNRQPWQFSLSGSVVTITAEKGVEVGSVSRRLDCGIAMLHFAIGAAQAGNPGEWEWAGSPQVGVFRTAAKV